LRARACGNVMRSSNCAVNGSRSPMRICFRSFGAWSSFTFPPRARALGYILAPLRGLPERMQALKRFSTLRYKRELGEDVFQIPLCVYKTYIRVGETALCISRQTAAAEEAALHLEV
jgi:hypothetical protein